MDCAAVLQAFNAQVRQSTRPDGTGALFEVDRPIVRRVAAPGLDGCCILWSELDADSADQAIAVQLAYFRALGQEVEWKLYSYDQPADLAERLLAAGFVPADEEALMVADVSEVALDVALPDGVRLEPVTDAEGISRVIAVHQEVFGSDDPELKASLLAQLRGAPEVMSAVLAVAGDEPISAARIEFVPGTEFAGLWGGGTLPRWRGRGIYRALVAYRAGLAAARGYQYLQVDASPESRPILERIGFSQLASTTPYIWSPGT